MTKDISIQSIIGLRCEKAWDGLLPVIFFEFGERQTTKKYRNDSNWEFSVGLDYCPWKIYKDQKLWFSSENSPQLIKQHLHTFTGKTLLNVEIDFVHSAAHFEFSDGLDLVTLHSEPEDQWYIISPKQVLVVGKDCEISVKERKD